MELRRYYIPMVSHSSYGEEKEYLNKAEDLIDRKTIDIENYRTK